MSQTRKPLTPGIFVRIAPLAAWHGLKVGLFASLLLIPSLLAMRAAGISLQDPGVMLPFGAIMMLLLLPVSFFEARRSDLKGRMRRAIES